MEGSASWVAIMARLPAYAGKSTAPSAAQPCRRRRAEPFADSHRRCKAAEADVDAGRAQRLVRLLGGGPDENLGAGLKLALFRRHEGDDRRLGRHDHRLLAVLVFQREPGA